MKTRPCPGKVRRFSNIGSFKLDAASSAAFIVTSCILVFFGGGFLVARISSAENADLSDEVIEPVRMRRNIVEVVLDKRSADDETGFGVVKKEKNFEGAVSGCGIIWVALRYVAVICKDDVSMPAIRNIRPEVVVLICAGIERGVPGEASRCSVHRLRSSNHSSI